MRNANLTFCILALTSSSGLPLLLIMLPKYLKESVSSSGSPPNMPVLLVFVLAFIILVLLLMILNPICVQTVFRRSVFPVSVGDCGTAKRVHLQNPGPPISSKASTAYHFVCFYIHTNFLLGFCQEKNGIKMLWLFWAIFSLMCNPPF